MQTIGHSNSLPLDLQGKDIFIVSHLLIVYSRPPPHSRITRVVEFYCYCNAPCCSELYSVHQLISQGFVSSSYSTLLLFSSPDCNKLLVDCNKIIIVSEVASKIVAVGLIKYLCGFPMNSAELIYSIEVSRNCSLWRGLLPSKSLGKWSASFRRRFLFELSNWISSPNKISTKEWRVLK